MIPRQGWSLFTREAARKAMRKAREARKRHVECLGSSRDPFGVPKDSGTLQGGTREAGEDHLDSLGGTREAPGRQERTTWTAWEAPGRQERTN